MYKFDKLQFFLDPDLCNKLLIDPSVIPSENFVCKTHLDKLTDSSDYKAPLFLKYVRRACFGSFISHNLV